MKLLDTNIVIYAQGQPHPLKEPCAALISMIPAEAEGVGFAVDTELLQEVLYVYDLRGLRKRGRETVSDLLALFPNPLAIAKEEIEKANELMGRYRWLGTRDAIHAAVVVTHRLEGIVSADRAFSRIKEIKHFSPVGA